MKNKIQINLGADHALECAEKIIGRSGEGLVTRLEIAVPEALTAYNAYIDFEKPNGETLRTPKLKVEYGVASYDVPQYLLHENGEIKVQLVFSKAKGDVWKSSKKKYTILKSINAEDDIPEKENFITEAQKVLDELSQEVNEIAEMLANNNDFAQAVIDACGGQTKIITINGKVLRFFVDTQEEYDKLSEAQRQNLFAIITDDTTKEYIESKLAIMEAWAETVRNGGETVGRANKAEEDTYGDEIKVADFLKTLQYPAQKDDSSPLYFPKGTLLTVKTGLDLKMYDNITNFCLHTNNGNWEIVYGGSEPDGESIVTIGGSWLVIGKCGSEKVNIYDYETTFNYYLITKVVD